MHSFHIFHSPSRGQSDAASTLTSQQGQNICRRWAAHGECRFGDSCHYQHCGKPGIGLGGKQLCNQWRFQGNCNLRGGRGCGFAHPAKCVHGSRCFKKKCTYLHPPLGMSSFNTSSHPRPSYVNSTAVQPPAAPPALTAVAPPFVPATSAVAPPPPPSESPPPPQASHASQAADNNSGSSHSECLVCMDRSKQGAFLPCGHMVCCMVCGAACDRCPVCRKRAHTFTRIFT